MKKRFLSGLVLGMFACLSSAKGEGEAVPGPVDASRYSPIWEKSPFDLQIGAAEVVEQGDWLLTSLAKIGGKMVVTLFNKKNQETAIIQEGNSSQSGVELVSVDYREDYQSSSVVVRLDGQSKKLAFLENELGQIAGMAPAAMNTNAPAPVVPGVSAPAEAGGTSTPRPTVRLIRRPQIVRP